MSIFLNPKKMNRIYFLMSLLLFIQCNVIFSQNYYNINFPQIDRKEKCKYYYQLFKEMPKEVGFSIKREGNKLYFVMNHQGFFDKLFQENGDGLAIDVVSKTRYTCSKLKIPDHQVKGLLLKPVYKEKLKERMEPYFISQFRTVVGTLPEEIIDDELEYNILFLKDKSLCRYQTFYDLKRYPWGLLDMGMYLDSLTYANKSIKPIGESHSVLSKKTLKFEIPFEKNQSDYKNEHIKPLYDSLKLTNFIINTINIRAYSSIEGSIDRNITLQQARAKSIAKALQNFQKSSIKTKINSSENWVDFYNDISGTKFSKFTSLSKNQIKNALIGNVVKEMEPILKNHRKAVVILELERIDKYKDKSIEEQITLFNKILKDNDIETAKEVQNSIFDKLNANQLSPDHLNKMEIPQQKKYSQFFNKNSANKFLLSQIYALEAYKELLLLDKMRPDKRVRYNLMVIKFTIWRFNLLPVDSDKFLKEIYKLKNYRIHKTLIERMLVNYHIVQAEKFMEDKVYAKKDKSVEYILKHYEKFSLSDYDYLSLAQFLSYYSNTEEAAELIEDKALELVIDENLLFYYLNLTLVMPNLTDDTDYRTIMLNAINMNKNRFCMLFNSNNDGGVTFQLLEDEYLRKTYCENCN